jgi:hypothetical protein
MKELEINFIPEGLTIIKGRGSKLKEIISSKEIFESALPGRDRS